MEQIGCELVCVSGCPFSQISWMWYLLSVVIVFALGALWYGKLFLKQWIEAVQFKCDKCNADYTKGEKCTCKCSPMWNMLLQFAATILIGLMYFALTAVSVWLAVFVAVAISAWMKATLRFREQNTKRWITLCAIEVGYFFVSSVIIILFALI